jgi:hypothetical protein
LGRPCLSSLPSAMSCRGVGQDRAGGRDMDGVLRRPCCVEQGTPQAQLR